MSCVKEVESSKPITVHVSERGKEPVQKVSNIMNILDEDDDKIEDIK